MKNGIAIGADHRGVALKAHLIAALPNLHWIDVGTNSTSAVDYPIFSQNVCDAVLTGSATVGILICGSGIGMSIAANRHKSIFAALCWNQQVAAAAKTDDCANVLVLPADFISPSDAISIIATFISTPCSTDQRYVRRHEMIDQKG